MSRIVFPDGRNVDWIPWNKLSRRSAGVDNSHFRWTSEKFNENSSTLPAINISPLTLSFKPLNEARKSCPRPLNSNLVIQLPPFSGSVKTRNTINFHSRSKNLTKEVIVNNQFLLSDSIPKANFLKPKSDSKKRKKKEKRSERYANMHRQKLEGIFGISVFSDGEV